MDKLQEALSLLEELRANVDVEEATLCDRIRDAIQEAAERIR